MSEQIAHPAAPLVVEQAGPLAVVTLNRPEVRNAIDLATALLLDEALTELERDKLVRVIILAATGPAFCAGADLKALASGEREGFIAGRGWAGLTARARTKPIIAAVEGPAVAGGCELVLACDLAVASRSATFALPEIKHGLIAAAGGAAALPHAIPLALAMEMLLTGAPIDAEKALQFGLINRLVEVGEALAGARELAAVIAAHPPAAIAATLQIVRASLAVGAGRANQLSRSLLGALLATKDTVEGVKAFAEHRAPAWAQAPD